MRALPLVALLLCACGTEWIDDLPPGFDGERFPGDGGAEPFLVDAGAEPVDLEFRLGQFLFFDRILSGNRNIACATCHVPFSSTTENIPLSIGEGGTGIGPTRAVAEGVILPRNTSALFLRGDIDTLFWDGRIERRSDGSLASPIELPGDFDSALEALVLVPIFDRDEMRGQPRDNELADRELPAEVADGVMARVLALPEYAELFEAAYPGESPTFAHLARAIVHFQTELWDRQDSTWDRVQNGEDDLEPAAGVGRRLFFGDAGCARCHSGPDFGGQGFHNIGVPQLGPGKTTEPGFDLGRAEVTGRAEDRFAFRTPPLRNVRLTGPWMHNGAYATLEAAVRHHLDPEAALASYDLFNLPESLRGQVRNDAESRAAILATLSDQVMPLRPLSELEIDQLVAFLGALDGEGELFRSPTTGVPDRVPSGLSVDQWPGGPHPFR